MKRIWLVILGVMLMGCASSALTLDSPEQIVGPEYHYLVLDGVS